MIENEIKVLADEMTRLLIGDPNGYKNFENLLGLVRSRVDISKAKEYNINFAALREDLIPVLDKYFTVK